MVPLPAYPRSRWTDQRPTVKGYYPNASPTYQQFHELALSQGWSVAELAKHTQASDSYNMNSS